MVMLFGSGGKEQIYYQEKVERLLFVVKFSPCNLLVSSVINSYEIVIYHVLKTDQDWITCRSEFSTLDCKYLEK